MAKIIYKKLSIKETNQTRAGVALPGPECVPIKPDIPCMGGQSGLWGLKSCRALDNPAQFSNK